MWQRRGAGRLLSRFNGGKPYKREHKASEAVQCWLTDEVTRFLEEGGNNVQEREREREQIAERDSVALSTENSGLAQGVDGRREGGKWYSGVGGARGMIEEPEVEDVVPSQ